MRSKIFAAVLVCMAIVACNKEKLGVTTHQSQSSQTLKLAARFTPDSTDTGNSRFINLDLANAMISSYLYSINSSQNDSDLRSFTVSADSLRAYLENSSIKNVKLVFAHTRSYINAGNTGVYAGYQSGALTIIIAAYDSAGHYVYYNGNVLDHLIPCPSSCPLGEAGNNLF